MSEGLLSVSKKRVGLATKYYYIKTRAVLAHEERWIFGKLELSDKIHMQYLECDYTKIIYYLSIVNLLYFFICFVLQTLAVE